MTRSTMLTTLEYARQNAREAAKSLTEALRLLEVEDPTPKRVFNELDDALSFLHAASGFARTVFDAIA